MKTKFLDFCHNIGRNYCIGGVLVGEQHRAYKFRLYPTAQQEILLVKTFGCTRFVYNHMLDRRSTVYKDAGKSLSRFDCNKLLPPLKAEYPFLKEVDSTALQAANDDLQAAFDAFFGKRAKYPTFHKKGHGGSYTTKSASLKVEGSRVFLPKVGWVKFSKSREVVGTIKRATVSREPSGRYYISILCVTDIPELPEVGASVGIDMGVRNIITLHDGTVVPGPKYLHQSMKCLIREQRKLSRRTKGSANWERQRVKVARLHEHIANQRTDNLHKLSTRIIHENQVVCIEDLDVAGMLKDKHRAKYNCDVGFREFRTMLEYKAKWYGRTVVAVPTEFASSQLCSHCAHKNEGLGSKTKWTCPACGTKHDRDRNAAINILNEGLRLLA